MIIKLSTYIYIRLIYNFSFCFIRVVKNQINYFQSLLTEIFRTGLIRVTTLAVINQLHFEIK